MLQSICCQNRLSSPTALQARFQIAALRGKRSRGGVASIYECYNGRRRLESTTPFLRFNKTTSEMYFSSSIIWERQKQTNNQWCRYGSSNSSIRQKKLHQLVTIQQEERKQRQSVLLQFIRNHVKHRINQIMLQTETDINYFQELVRKKKKQQNQPASAPINREDDDGMMTVNEKQRGSGMYESDEPLHETSADNCLLKSSSRIDNHSNSNLFQSSANKDETKMNNMTLFDIVEEINSQGSRSSTEKYGTNFTSQENSLSKEDETQRENMTLFDIVDEISSQETSKTGNFRNNDVSQETSSTKQDENKWKNTTLFDILEDMNSQEISKAENFSNNVISQESPSIKQVETKRNNMTLFDIVEEMNSLEGNSSNDDQPSSISFTDDNRITHKGEDPALDNDEDLVYQALIADYLVNNEQNENHTLNNIDMGEKLSANINQGEESPHQLLYSYILELLVGVNQRKYHLNTTDFNIILSALMLSSHHNNNHVDCNDEDEVDSFSFDAAENMHTVYQLMRDLSPSSAESISPDINTVCLVTSVLLREGARSAAANIWGDILSQKNLTNKGDQQVPQLHNVMDDQSLIVGIKCLTSAGKTFISQIESVIKNAAATSRYNTEDYAYDSTPAIPEDVLFTLIEYYKDVKEPQKLRDLIYLCINSRQYDNRTMNHIITKSIQLGKIGETNNEIPLQERINHCELILSLLRQEQERFIPHISLWKRLLKTLSQFSRQNPASCFPMIAEACQIMIFQKQEQSSGINDGLRFFPGYAIIKNGIDAAEYVQNPQLAADLLRWGWDTSDMSFSGINTIEQQNNDENDATATGTINETTSNEDHATISAPLDVMKNSKEEYSFDDVVSEFLQNYNEDKHSNSMDTVNWDTSETHISGINTIEHQNNDENDATATGTLNETTSNEDHAAISTPLDVMKNSKEEFSFDDIVSDFLQNYNEDKHSNSMDDKHSNSVDTESFGIYDNQMINSSNNKLSASMLFRVLNLCFSQRNSMLANETLRYCIASSAMGDDSIFPTSIWSQFYNMVIACHAQKGETKEAKELLNEMQNNGIMPSEKDYGLIIHSLAMEKRKEEAFEMMSDMICNKFGDDVRPGSSCYAACMFAAMQVADWESVLALSEKMMEDSVSPNDVTIHGALLASSRLNDRKKAVELLRQAVDHGIGFSLGSLRHVIPLFVAETARATDDSMNCNSLADAQKLVEKIGKQHDHLIASEALELSKTMRLAEEKISHKLSQNLNVEDKHEREKIIWREVLIKCHALFEKLVSSDNT